ncbi:MAG: CARDB domain-containing protein [Thermoleophilaceae bacterium]
MVRRIAAGVAGLIVVLLLLFAFKGCLDGRKDQALEDYVAEVRALVKESDRQGDGLFGLLSDPAAAGSEVEVENQLNAFRNEASQFVERAKDIDHPDELDGAHGSLVEVLRFRSDGVSKVADLVPTVTGQGDQAQSTEDIAGSNQLFLVSDVIFSQRFAPILERELTDQGLRPERLKSNYLKDIEFLQPDVVADRIGGGGGDRADGDAAPGTHGNGLGAVTLGGQTLAPGGSASVALGEDLEFDVQVTNQGENTETDVQVNVVIGEGGDAVNAESVLDEIAAGETKSVQIPLSEEPATGQNVPIKIEIEGVPGEKMLDNNQGEFTAVFTR